MSFYANIFNWALARASVQFDREVTLEAVLATCKARYHVEPRWFCMAYLHATGRYSMPQIARALGLKDHTTVLFGLRRAHGYDGKPITIKRKGVNSKVYPRPLWKKEQFKNMVAQDGTAYKLPPQPYERVNAEQILAIGLANLARYRGAPDLRRAA